MRRKRAARKNPLLPMMTRSEIIPIKAAGGVLYNVIKGQVTVLLIQRNGVWDLPKGKLEKGETIEECAVREVEEEIGAENLSIVAFLCETYHEYRQNGNKYGKTTYWYAMNAGQEKMNLVPQVEEGITKVKWMELGEAISMIEFENLVNVLKKLGSLHR